MRRPSPNSTAGSGTAEPCGASASWPAATEDWPSPGSGRSRSTAWTTWSGVTLDGDLGRLLPHELARLSLPELEDDTLRRLAERQLMSREYHGTEPVAKGPVILCVDESGSMHGEKVHTAKALALAMAWVARQQRRWIAPGRLLGRQRRATARPAARRWNEAALMDWLEPSSADGSSSTCRCAKCPGSTSSSRRPWATPT